MQNSLQSNKCFLFVYLHCLTVFILDLNDFLALMSFYKIYSTKKLRKLCLRGYDKISKTLKDF